MRQKSHLVLTAAGPDRVGLVERLAEAVSRHQCNIEDSKMAAFCGEFAIIMLISGESENLEKIRDKSAELEAETGLAIRSRTHTARFDEDSRVQMRLTASCMDHPGIVHRISKALRRFGINIESMETTTYAAPVSGAPLFQFHSRIGAPATLRLETLREALDQIQREENIDIDLQT